VLGARPEIAGLFEPPRNRGVVLGESLRAQGRA
jgi:hypothetical protein